MASLERYNSHSENEVSIDPEENSLMKRYLKRKQKLQKSCANAKIRNKYIPPKKLISHQKVALNLLKCCINTRQTFLFKHFTNEIIEDREISAKKIQHWFKKCRISVKINNFLTKIRTVIKIQQWHRRNQICSFFIDEIQMNRFILEKKKKFWFFSIKLKTAILEKSISKTPLSGNGLKRSDERSSQILDIKKENSKFNMFFQVKRKHKSESSLNFKSNVNNCNGILRTFYEKMRSKNFETPLHQSNKESKEILSIMECIKKLIAIIVLQKWYRNIKMEQYIYHYILMYRNSQMIQKCYKRYFERKCNILFIKKVINLIEEWYKKHISVKLYQKYVKQLEFRKEHFKKQRAIKLISEWNYRYLQNRKREQNIKILFEKICKIETIRKIYSSFLIEKWYLEVMQYRKVTSKSKWSTQRLDYYTDIIDCRVKYKAIAIRKWYMLNYVQNIFAVLNIQQWYKRQMLSLKQISLVQISIRRKIYYKSLKLAVINIHKWQEKEMQRIKNKNVMKFQSELCPRLVYLDWFRETKEFPFCKTYFDLIRENELVNNVINSNFSVKMQNYCKLRIGKYGQKSSDQFQLPNYEFLTMYSYNHGKLDDNGETSSNIMKFKDEILCKNTESIGISSKIIQKWYKREQKIDLLFHFVEQNKWISKIIKWYINQKYMKIICTYLQFISASLHLRK
ncbi:uncharacterized protein LOC111628644 [Centruroides sculpturatus]|uniref:uncharacterized protein LOC111628644 n=1 Tax=Centruroides sculpturatus TaxID=218467 RepID=UPI000C6EB16B|nr:uncharacterized protein LOC111628644 [Centruroides sculpturatus]